MRREDRAAAKKTKAANGDADKAPPCFSAKLIEDLTAHRTAALQAMLADNPKVALAAVVHALALGVFYTGDGASSLQIAPRVVFLDRSAEGIAEDATAAQAACGGDQGASGKRLAETRRQVMGVDAAARPENLARRAGSLRRAYRRCRREKTMRSAPEHAAQLAAALKLDMADYWQPTAAGYFGRVSKEQSLPPSRSMRCQRQGRLCHAQESGAG